MDGWRRSRQPDDIYDRDRYIGATAETPETQLALKKVDVYGDIAPPHVQDPMTMVLRQNAIQADHSAMRRDAETSASVTHGAIVATTPPDDQVDAPTARLRWIRAPWRGRWHTIANRTISGASSRLRYPSCPFFVSGRSCVSRSTSATGFVPACHSRRRLSRTPVHDQINDEHALAEFAATLDHQFQGRIADNAGVPIMFSAVYSRRSALPCRPTCARPRLSHTPNRPRPRSAWC